MPRRKRKLKRQELKPDPRYNSLRVAIFINKVMREGKKDIARRIVYNALDLTKAKIEKEPVEILTQAINNVKPQQEVRSRRVGGSNYQVPMAVRADRAETLAMRWIITAAKSKKVSMEKALAQELITAYNGEGEAMKKKEEVQRMAEANRAFAHFKW
ncbi:30S ribosomal protein S7 [Patescibacteria group bacterium]|nr:30S ribosomal protein S7 [Patescibacteria group bacterium]